MEGERVTATAQDRRTLVVLAVSAANLVLTLAAWVFGLHEIEHAAVAGWQPPAWALVVMFAITEAVVLHVQLRRETQAISLSEIPLVLALLFVAPVTLLWTRLVGPPPAPPLHPRDRKGG